VVEEEPTYEAEIITRLEFSIDIQSIQQLQVYRYLYDMLLTSHWPFHHKFSAILTSPTNLPSIDVNQM
jgi:hypothetical protein